MNHTLWLGPHQWEAEDEKTQDKDKETGELYKIQML